MQDNICYFSNSILDKGYLLNLLSFCYTVIFSVFMYACTVQVELWLMLLSHPSTSLNVWVRK